MTGPNGETRNSITDIMKFLSDSGKNPFKDGEFKEFWTSLSEEEKLEFKQTELPEITSE